MSREFTVLLKQPEFPPRSRGSRFWGSVNEIIKSPAFGFFFGASIVTAAPFVKTLLTPEKELKSQRAEQQARADAALVAPFLGNLSTSEPGKFAAAKAALDALAETARAAEKDHQDRPMFKAVTAAVTSVAIDLKPKPPAPDPAKTAEIDRTAVAATPVSSTAYGQLKSSVIYIQVSRDNSALQDLAARVMAELQAHGIIAPGIERLDPTVVPGKTQVRYFDDADFSKAQDLAGIVAEVTKFPVFVAKPDLKAKPGTLELWFGKLAVPSS